MSSPCCSTSNHGIPYCDVECTELNVQLPLSANIEYPVMILVLQK